MLGYNETETPSKLERFSAKNSCDDMKELLAVEKVDKAVVIGHDWGGYIAWRFANYYPDLVQYLIVLCTPYSPPYGIPFPGWDVFLPANPNFGYMPFFSDPKNIPDFNTHRRVFLSTIFRRAEDPDTGLIDRSTQQFTFDFSRAKDVPQTLQTEEEVEVINNQIAKQGFEGPTNWYRLFDINAAEEKQLKPALQINLKTLFIAATKDPYLPPTPERLASTHKYVVGGLEVKYVEASHFVQVEKPKEVNEIIAEWLNKQTKANL